MTKAADLVKLARAKGQKLTTAESCTGGMLSAAITDVAGSSAIFDRGFVTYSNAAKIEMLGVRESTLDQHGAVSEQVAAEMASGAIAQPGADIAISITGIAGPGGSDHKPEGRVCFGIAMSGGATATTMEFGAIGRENVRLAARDHGLAMLWDALT